jgi:hypothetical protein
VATLPVEVAPARSGPSPQPAPPAPAPSAAPPSASQPASEGPLDEAKIQATISRSAGAFAACAARARRDEPQLVSEPRNVTVTMTVNPSGRVLYPTLDDQELSGTALGDCLKREAGRMSFPASGGEAMRVRMPLVLK